jgi:hypothetical protein
MFPVMMGKQTSVRMLYALVGKGNAQLLCLSWSAVSLWDFAVLLLYDSDSRILHFFSFA